MGTSDSTAKLCQVCSQLDIELLTHPLQPCRDPLPCSTPPLRQVGTFLALGSIDEIKSRRSSCSICGLIAENLDKEPAGLDGECRIAESAEFCTFKLPTSLEPRDPTVTHFHLTQTLVIFDTSKASQFQGPSLPWELEERDKEATHYILCFQAKAGSSAKAGDETHPSKAEEELLDTIGGRYVAESVNTELMQAWLQRCESEHGEDCVPSSRLPAGPHNVPTFVIDVKQSCIVDTPSDCRYVALSYVWGSAAVIKHIKENSKDLRKTNSLSSLSLPATIQDSVTLVHDIGERYLWVDSLCIIQDDAKMRDPEIRRMGSIYSKALFTIVAAAGDNANSGLPGVKQGTRKDVQKSLKLANCELLTVIDLSRKPSGIDDVTWAQRAWTFQERVLSNRMLVFSEDQVYWSCRSSMYSEERALEDVRDIDQLRFSFPQKSVERLPWEPLEPAEYRDIYDDLLSDYRQRYLSFKTDLVNAFSGITEILAAFQKDTFVWGLPESLFSYALTWSFTGHSTRNNVKVPIPDGNGSTHMIPFPSWSWAAWSGTEQARNPLSFFLHAGYSTHVRPLIHFYLVDVELKLIRIEEWLWEDHPKDNTLWWDDDAPPPLTHPLPRTGQLRFWTMLANVRAIRRWRFQGPGQVEYIPFPPPNFEPKPHSTHYFSEIVDQDFIVIAADCPDKLVLLAIEWQDGVAYRVGRADVSKVDWMQVKNREWRFITLG